MAMRRLTLPLIEHEKTSFEEGYRGEKVPRVERTYDVDTLGVRVDAAVIDTNYRDCGKVLVTAAEKVLDELQAKSRSHFAEEWGGR